MEGLRRHRSVPLGYEDVRRRPLLALQAPQGAYLVALHRVDTRRAVLRPADVQPAGGQLNLRPLQIAQFGRPQAVAVTNQDHGCVPVAVAARCPGRRHQAFLTAASCRLCCKSPFPLGIKNSPGCRRDFHVKMWGTSSPDDKLTGDLGNAFEAAEIGGRWSDRLLAVKLSSGDFGLLQQYPLKAEVNSKHL